MPSSSRGRAARRRPDIQKCAVDDVGRLGAPLLARARAANAGMCGSSSSLGTAPGGPASTWSTSTPRASGDALAAAPGRRGGCGRRPRARAGRAPRRAPPRGRSGRPRRRRRGRRAGSRARTPWRSSSRAPPPSSVVPVGEEAREPVALERWRRAAAPALAGRSGSAQEPRGPPRPARRRGSRRRRRRRAPPRAPRSSPSATTGMPRCIASSSESPSDVQRIGCRYTRRRAISSCSRPAAGRRCPPERATWRPSRTGRAARPAREALEQVGAGHARAAARLVDDDRGARQRAAVAVAGVDDAVLDHARRRGARSPRTGR